MDFSRLALRLAMIETLAPTNRQADTPWPTLAEEVVMDSRIEPNDLRLIAEKRPLIGVFTDEDEAEPYGSGVDILAGANAKVTLAFEVVVPMRLPPQGTSAGDLVLYAVTDASVEARLDLVCGQIMQAIRNGLMSGPLAAVVKAVARRESHTYRDADTDARLSARRLSLTVEVRHSDEPGNPAAAGLARLPQPLRAVAEQLPAGSYGRKICETLAEAVPGGLPRVPLESIDLSAWIEKTDPTPETPDVAGTIPTT